MHMRRTTVERTEHPVLVRMWSKENCHTSLTRVLIHITTSENYVGRICKAELGIPRDVGIPFLGLYTIGINRYIFIKRHKPECS